MESAPPETATAIFLPKSELGSDNSGNCDAAVLIFCNEAGAENTLEFDSFLAVPSPQGFRNNDTAIGL